MKELVNQLITALQGVAPHVSELEAAESRVASAKSQLAEVNTKLTDANKGLNRMQVQAAREHDEAIFSKQQELKRLQDQIEAGQKTLNDLSSAVTQKQIFHRQLEESLDSLRKRLG